MDDNMTSKAVINNEFDYSNIVANVEAITYLVQYCDSMEKQLKKLIEEDEEKNKRFKNEYKDYMYKKTYSERFEVYIRSKSYQNSITCNDYESFVSAVKDGNLKNVSGLDIKLDLDFERGKGDNLDKHENSFKIVFNPYDITFTRISNHNDPSMNQIETQINDILKRFQVVNTIFCTK